MHVHGGGGRDFMEGTEEAFRVAINAHAKARHDLDIPHTFIVNRAHD